MLRFRSGVFSAIERSDFMNFTIVPALVIDAEEPAAIGQHAAGPTADALAFTVFINR